MPIELIEKKPRASRPVHPVARDGLSRAGLDGPTLAWAKATGFNGEAGRSLLVPGPNGEVAAALFGTGKPEESAALGTGALAKALPEGDWHFADTPADPTLSTLGVVLGGYAFTRYGKKAGKDIRLTVPDGADAAWLRRIADGVFLARDLVNTPTNDMGPDELEQAVRTLARKHKAKVSVVKGDDLSAKNFPMIHAVGRASDKAPRLIDMAWGDRNAPKVTLVGKGVCFDTGGLDIKPSSGMLLMKKDMGGAANVLGLASMIMSSRLKVRLRVLIPAVENAIAGNAFRPGDILKSRKGPTVEIGNTDAEGRLVLADALALADEEEPEPPGRHGDADRRRPGGARPRPAALLHRRRRLRVRLAAAAKEQEDPLWRMPLWRPYDAKLSSKVADMNNVTSTALPARSPPRCSSSASSRERKRGHISTYSPGIRPIGRTARPAERHKASAPWRG